MNNTDHDLCALSLQGLFGWLDGRRQTLRVNHVPEKQYQTPEEVFLKHNAELTLYCDLPLWRMRLLQLPCLIQGQVQFRGARGEISLIRGKMYQKKIDEQRIREQIQESLWHSEYTPLRHAYQQLTIHQKKTFKQGNHVQQHLCTEFLKSPDRKRLRKLYRLEKGEEYMLHLRLSPSPHPDQISHVIYRITASGRPAGLPNAIDQAALTQHLTNLSLLPRLSSKESIEAYQRKLSVYYWSQAMNDPQLAVTSKRLSKVANALEQPYPFLIHFLA